MKAQASIEFMFSVLAVIFVISLLFSVFSFLNSNARVTGAILEKTMEAEHDARLLELYLANHLSVDFPFNISGRIEYGKFKEDYDGRIIEIKGVFDNVPMFSEPS